MKHYFVVSIIIIGLMGCSAPVKHGAEFDDQNVDNIVKGETTKYQLIEWFGEPGIKSTVSENEENSWPSPPGLSASRKWLSIMNYSKTTLSP